VTAAPVRLGKRSPVVVVLEITLVLLVHLEQALLLQMVEVVEVVAPTPQMD
jgi:hypothetical protein